jgi:CHAT domain-containing protein
VLGDPPFSPEQRESPGSCEESIVLASSYRGAPSPFQERGVGVAIAANSADGLAKSALAGSAEALADLKSLPCARREAESVGALFGKGATVLVGQGASEQALARMAETGELQDYRVLHFATHALVDDERPERSALILSQVGLPDKLTAAFAGTRIYDGCVSAEEVVGEWKLDADLVTLSACETGLGRRIAGEGYIGLAHAFLQAGARSLLVSLWNVEDRSTSLLMQRFYENWLGRSGDAKEAPGEHMPTSRATTRAEALQEAKRWLRDYTAEGGGHPYADPVYWAGFILIGDSD